MKTLLVVFPTLFSSFLFYTLAFADICTDVEQKTGLDLNEAECYVLEQVEKGELAHFKKGEDLSEIQLFKVEFQDRFFNIEDRRIGAAFLKNLLIGSLADLKATDEGVRIKFAIVSETLELEGAKIPFSISINNCIFEERVSFDRATFSGKASFYGATFSGRASFDEAEFFGEAYFLMAKFSEKAGFGWATFSGRTIFYHITFLKEADFSSCDFSSKSNFEKALFHDTVIFDNVSGFSKMVVEWKYSPDKFGEEEDGKIIELRELSKHLKYNQTFYIALIKNYQDMGWFSEADDCYYTYRVEKRNHRLSEIKKVAKGVESNPTAFSRLWEKAKLYGEWLFLDLTFGYGVRPYKILITFFAFWIPFSFYYVGFVRSNYEQKLMWWKAWNPFFQPSRFLWSSIYSLDTLTPGVNFESLKSLKKKVLIKSDSKRILYVKRFQQILGWYWAALFLILFSKIWIR